MSYLLTSAILLLGLGLIWRTTDALNLILKLFIFGLGVWGFTEYLR